MMRDVSGKHKDIRILLRVNRRKKWKGLLARYPWLKGSFARLLPRKLLRASPKTLTLTLWTRRGLSPTHLLQSTYGADLASGAAVEENREEGVDDGGEREEDAVVLEPSRKRRRQAADEIDEETRRKGEWLLPWTSMKGLKSLSGKLKGRRGGAVL